MWVLHLLCCYLLAVGLEGNRLFCFYCYQWPVDYLWSLNLEYCVFILHFSSLPISYMLLVHCCLFSVLLCIYSFCVCMSIALQLIVNVSRVSMSGIPSRAGSFPGTTKICTTFVYSSDELLHYKYLIVELLSCHMLLGQYSHAFWHWVLFFFIFIFFFALGNNILQIWICIIFPLLHVSVLPFRP